MTRAFMPNLVAGLLVSIAALVGMYAIAASIESALVATFVPYERPMELTGRP